MGGFRTFLPTRAQGSLPSPSEDPLVAILVRDSLRVQPISYVHHRMCGVLISSSKGPIALISAYIHFVEGGGLADLSSMVALARQRTPFILLGADSNGHSPWWGPPSQATNKTGELVEEFILAEHLMVENTWPCSPTFISEQGFEAWIDITLSSPHLSPFVTAWRVLSDAVLDSDHAALAFSLQFNTPRAQTRRLDWRHVQWDSFRAAMQEALTHGPHLLSPPSSPPSIDDYARDIHDAFDDTIARHVPVKCVSQFSNPWWSPHLDDLRSQVTRARRKWKQTQARSDKKIVNECKRTLRRAIVEAKRRSWRDFCEGTSGEDLWSAFQKVTRRRFSTHMPDLVIDGERLADDLQKAKALASRFFPPEDPITAPSHLDTIKEVRDILQFPRPAEAPPVTRQELHSAIHASGPWKAQGLDRIANVCLRQCEDILTPYLLPLFSASLKYGHVPRWWKEADVIALPKAEGDPSSPKGYRPISLLSCLSKVLERIVTDRLTFFLESQCLLSPHQFGFRKGHSTERAL